MKAILEFNLPDEDEEFRLAQDGGKYLAAINDFRTYMRTQEKYCELSDDEAVGLNSARDAFYEILKDYDIR